jgi:hypothetical protein
VTRKQLLPLIPHLAGPGPRPGQVSQISGADVQPAQPGISVSAPVESARAGARATAAGARRPCRSAPGLNNGTDQPLHSAGDLPLLESARTSYRSCSAPRARREDRRAFAAAGAVSPAESQSRDESPHHHRTRALALVCASGCKSSTNTFTWCAGPSNRPDSRRWPARNSMVQAPAKRRLRSRTRHGGWRH